MNTDKLRDFIFGMKRANKRQVIGQLFVVDVETGDVCGCALGQGLIEAGIITEEEIKKEAANAQSWPITDVNGKIFDAKYPTRVTTKGYDWLHENFGQTFTSYVYHQNDDDKRSVLDIAVKAFNRYFGAQNG